MSERQKFWHWINRTFGQRSYYKGADGKVYIKEGFNPPEELFAHLKRYHPEAERTAEVLESYQQKEKPRGGD